MRRPWTLLLLAVLAGSAWAETPDLVPGTIHKDKALGFELRLFADTAAVPPRRTTKFVDKDLAWYESQVVRSWVVQRGGKNPTLRLRVLLGRLGALPREGSREPAGADPSRNWDEADLAEWIEAFSEMSLDGDAVEVKAGPLTVTAWRLTGEKRAGTAFLLRREGESFLLVYKHPADWKAEKAVRDSAKTFKFKKPSKVKARELKLPGRGKVDPALEEARKATVERVRRSIRGLDSWWWHAADHYVVTSNVDAKKHRDAVRKAVGDLEKIRKAYAALLPAPSPIRAVSVVKFFSHRDQIFAHFSERQPKGLNLGVIGMWVNVYDELVLTLNPEKVKDALTTLFHEGFHQYMYYAAGGTLDPPRWFDEGTADFFGGAVFEKNGVRFAENPTRSGKITQIVNGAFQKRYGWVHPPLKKLLGMSREEFYRETKWLVFQYTMAWSAVYFLRNGIGKDSPYAGLLETYFRELLNTRSRDKAYEASFGKVDMDALERDWKAFYLDPEARKKAALKTVKLK